MLPSVHLVHRFEVRINPNVGRHGGCILHQVFSWRRNNNACSFASNQANVIALDCYDHYEEKTLVEMCIGNMIMEYRAVFENLEIFQFMQLLQKARKTTQSIRPSFDKPKEWKSTPQAMTVSTGKKKRKSDGREYETPSITTVYTKRARCAPG